MGQIIDEVAICWINTWAAFHGLPRRRSNQLLGRRFTSLVNTWHFVAAYVMATIVIGLTLPLLSHLLTISTIPLSVYVMSWTMKNLPSECRGRLRPICIRSIGAGALGFTFWLIDRFACSLVHAALGFNPQFHAMWHILIFISGHYYGLLLISVIFEESKTPYRFSYLCKQLIVCETIKV